MSDQDAEPVLTGWDSWERYFVSVHGPRWREKRCGVNGYLCAYCSGKIQSRMPKRSPFAETITTGGYTVRPETLTPSPDEESPEPERTNP